RPLPWLICYDVRCPKRLVRLHRRLVHSAAPVQYSVFLFYGTTDHAEALMDELASHYIRPADDLRAYPIEPKDSLLAFGQHRCPAHWPGWSRLLQHGCLPDTFLAAASAGQARRQMTDLEGKKRRLVSRRKP